MSRRQRIVVTSGIILVSVIALMALVALSITRTEYGQGQVRKFVQAWVSGKVRGTIHVGRISGGLLNGVVIDSLEIRDDQDSLFISSGKIRVRYDLRDLFDRRILLSHLNIEHPVVHVTQHENGDWNWRRIFPEGAETPQSAGRGFGDFIVMDSADVRDAVIRLTLPWHPSDTLRGSKRDSAVARARIAHPREAGQPVAKRDSPHR